jgi:hypothetical protein
VAEGGVYGTTVVGPVASTRTVVGTLEKAGGFPDDGCDGARAAGGEGDGAGGGGEGGGIAVKVRLVGGALAPVPPCSVAETVTDSATESLTV